MKKIIPLLILLIAYSCEKNNSIVRDNITFEISTYEEDNRIKVSAFPILRTDSKLKNYKRRFDYLLLNTPDILSINNRKKRDSINSLYPDTAKVKQIYLEYFCNDEKLIKHFENTANAINNTDIKKESFTIEDLMEVSSKFFYCDQVNPDTSVQMHVCIGLNGLKEAKWDKDYTLLSAFCFEAIFNDLDKDDSQLRDAYSAEHKAAVDQFKKSITSLDLFLENVKQNLFLKMKNNAILKEKLLDYYKLNKSNVAFEIVN